MASRCSCQLSPLLSEAELDHRCPDRSLILLNGREQSGFGVAKVLVKKRGRMMQHKYEIDRVHTICPCAISPPKSQKVKKKKEKKSPYLGNTNCSVVPSLSANDCNRMTLN